MMPDEAAFSRESTGCSHGSYVDIVGVTGSIPVTPTIQALENQALSAKITKCPAGSQNLWRQLILAAKSLAARPPELRGPFIVNHELVERIARVSFPSIPEEPSK